MTNLREQFWAVEVPEGAEKYRIMNFSNPNTLSYDYSIESNGRMTKGLIAMIDLPPGTWSIVCTSKRATEDQCAKIAGVPEADIVHGWNRTFFHDLLTSRGLDVNKQYLILKKEA